MTHLCRILGLAKIVYLEIANNHLLPENALILVGRAQFTCDLLHTFDAPIFRLKPICEHVVGEYSEPLT